MSAFYRFLGILLFFGIFTFRTGYAQQNAVVDSFNYYEQKDYSKAVILWEDFGEDCTDHELVKKAGTCYKNLRNFQKSIRLFRKSIGLIQSGRDIDYFPVYSNLSLSFRLIGEYDSARYYIKKSFKILDQAGKYNVSDSNEFQATYFLNYGKLMSVLQKNDSAEILFLRSLNEFAKCNPREVVIYSTLMSFYINKADYQKAIEFGLKGLSNAENQNDRFNFYYNLGRGYYALNKWDHAIIYFTKALSIITANTYRFKSYIENVLFYCYAKTSQSVESRPIKSDLNSIDTLPYTYHLICYGKYLENNRHDSYEAMKQYQEAFALLKLKFGKHHNQLKDIYSIIGYSNFKIHQPDSALYYYQRALYCRNPEADTSDYTSNPAEIRQADSWVLDLVGRKIRVLSKIRQEKLSSDSARNIDRLILANADYYSRLIEILLHDKTFLADQVHLLGKDIRSFMLAGMDACQALYHSEGDSYYLEKALSFSETGKYLLLKSMMDSRVNKKRLPDSLARLDEELYGQINRLHMEIGRVKAGGEENSTDSLDKKLFALILRKDSLRNEILQKVPGIQQWESKDLSLEELMTTIRPGQLLVEYYIQDTVLHSFFLSDEGVEWKRKVLNGRFYKALDAVSHACNPFQSNLVGRNEYGRQAFVLYNELLGTVYQEQLPGSELLLIPDGALIYLPFEALLTQMPDSNCSWRSMPYLIHERSIGYLHSLHFVQAPRGVVSTKNEFLALAPSFGIDSSTGMQATGWELNAAMEEVKHLKEILPGEVLLDTAATMGNFVRHAKGKQILHFATHAETDSANVFDSWLMLSLNPETCLPQPLYASDICSMNLDAKMAVLSTCSSGNGELLDGEGVISLAWAFRYAGCESVAMSLFPLDDKSANTIMTSFYRHLKDGKSKNEALQVAKLQYLEESVPFKCHPQYWAGIVITGNQQALFNGNSFTKKLLVTIALFAAGIVITLLLMLKLQRGRVKSHRNRV